MNKGKALFEVQFSGLVRMRLQLRRNEDIKGLPAPKLEQTTWRERRERDKCNKCDFATCGD